LGAAAQVTRISPETETVPDQDIFPPTKVGGNPEVAARVPEKTVRIEGGISSSEARAFLFPVFWSRMIQESV
jgi:hypothetical protein